MRGSQGAAASSCRCLLMSCCRAAAPCPVQVLFLVDIRKNWILIRSNFCASRTFWRKLILVSRNLAQLFVFLCANQLTRFFFSFFFLKIPQHVVRPDYHGCSCLFKCPSPVTFAKKNGLRRGGSQLKYMGIELDLGDEILELISPN
ncbi:hypothetical protein SEVIR_1G132101v4 [Setaria viridis]